MLDVQPRPSITYRPQPFDSRTSAPKPAVHRCTNPLCGGLEFGNTPAMVLTVPGGVEVCPACAARELAAGRDTLGTVRPTHPGAGALWNRLERARVEGQALRRSQFLADVRAAMSDPDTARQVRELVGVAQTDGC